LISRLGLNICHASLLNTLPDSGLRRIRSNRCVRGGGDLQRCAAGVSADRDVAPAGAVACEVFWAAGREVSGTPTKSSIGFGSAVQRAIFRIGSAEKKGHEHSGGKQNCGNRQRSSKEAAGPDRNWSSHRCPQRNAVSVGEFAAAFDFQQAFADHSVRTSKSLTLIRIPMQHSGKQPPQRFREF
jgi:hypothetical protein